MITTYTTPAAIPLTTKEAELFAKLPSEQDLLRKEWGPERWSVVADAMQELFELLDERKAIPEIRLLIFCDPDYAEIGKRSPQDIFEANGNFGIEIVRHPHFIPYLRYFINGPDLPNQAISGLCKILNDDMGTSGMLLKQYQQHARSSVRNHNLDRSDAARELFRLALELGMDIHEARNLRDAAKAAR